MIDVKIIKKSKGSDTSSGGSGSGGGGVVLQDNVSHAEEADYASRAGNADRAEYADKAGQANNAAYADRAGNLDEDSEVYDKFLRKDIDDTAHGDITFEQDIDVEGDATVSGLTTLDGKSEHNALAEFNQDFNLKNEKVGRIFGSLEFKTPVSDLDDSSDDSSDSSDEYEGIDGQLNGRISGNGNAQFTKLVVTDSNGATPYATATELNGITEISEVYGEALTGQQERFIDGYQGHGFGIWKDENNKWNLTTDNLTVRQQMKVFELLIQKIRSTGGTIVVSCANGKIKTVTHRPDTTWQLTFETDVDFAVGDIIRCQTSKGLGVLNSSYENRVWQGNVLSVQGTGANKFIIVSVVGNNPDIGDEVVQWGSDSNTGRQNLIYITVAENDKPAIDMMSGVTAVNNGNLRVRIGMVGGLAVGGYTIPANEWGLYADNAYLKGKLILQNGDDVAQKFVVADGKFESVISGTRAKLIGDSIIHNQAFTIGDNCFDGWSFYGVTGSLVLSDGSDILSDGQHILSSSADTNKYVAVITEEDQLTHFVRIWDSVSSNPSIGIQQSVSVMRNVTFASGETDPKLVQFSFKYRIPNNQPAQIKILFTTQQGNIVGRVDSNNPTMGKIVFSNDGEWHDAVFYGTYAGRDANNINALTILAKGKIDITDICMVQAEAVQELSTSIEQTDERVSVMATSLETLSDKTQYLQTSGFFTEAAMAGQVSTAVTNQTVINSLHQNFPLTSDLSAYVLQSAYDTAIGNINDTLATKTSTSDVQNLITQGTAGFVSSGSLASMFTGYWDTTDPNNPHFDAYAVATAYVYDSNGVLKPGLLLHANQISQIAEDITLTADKINFNGYINANGLTIDTEGNVTTFGVVNNGQLVISNSTTASSYILTDPRDNCKYLDVLRCPPTLIMNYHISELCFPCAYYGYMKSTSASKESVILGETKYGKPNGVADYCTIADMRMMIGKKIRVYFTDAMQDGECGIKAPIMVHRSPDLDMISSTIPTGTEPTINLPTTSRLVCYPKTDNASAYSLPLGMEANTYVDLECKSGRWDGNECIYWERTDSGTVLFDFDDDSSND